MTLHQAAQKAVEALPRFRWDQDMDVLAGPYPDGEWVRRADVIAALQQQPAPVGHVVVDMQSNGPGDRIKWTKLALEHGTPLYASPPAIQPPAQSAIDKVRDLRDVQGQQGIGTDNYMRGLYNGLELALCTLEEREPDYAEKAALQHQEVPCGNTPYDEGPFTIATDGGQEVPREPSEEMMTAGLRAACLYDTPESRRDLARAWKVMSALYASPSTTRQQEVGSDTARLDWLERERAEACKRGYQWNTWAYDALQSDLTIREQIDKVLAAAPSTPENADGGPHG